MQNDATILLEPVETSQVTKVGRMVIKLEDGRYNIYDENGGGLDYAWDADEARAIAQAYEDEAVSEDHSEAVQLLVEDLHQLLEDCDDLEKLAQIQAILAK